MNTQAYQVLPRLPSQPDPAVIKGGRKPVAVSFLGLAILLGFSAFMVTMAIVEVKNIPRSEAVTLISWVQGATLLLSFVAYLARRWEAKRWLASDVERDLAEEWKRRIHQSELEAHDLSQEMNRQRRSCAAALGGLAICLERVAASLRDAQQEYEEHAYSPFWDHIESAAKELANFYASCDLLRTSSSALRDGLKGRVHNFPPPIASVRIPDPSPAVTEFNGLVRLGQRSYEFAVIWEHRRTRAAIIEGFATLGEAVQSLGEKIDSNYLLVRDQLSQCFEDMTKEQREMRLTFEEALREWEVRMR